MRHLKLAFVSGLSDKKLAQKLAPLQTLPEVERIDLYRRRPLYGDKICWIPMPGCCSRTAPLGDLWRLAVLIKKAPHYDVIIGCHQFFHGVYASVAALLRGRETVQLTIKDPERIRRSPLGGWALRHADAIGFRGHTTLQRFRDRDGNHRPLFVPQNVWEPSVKTTRKTRKIDLLYVGNFAPDKNIPAWLRAAAQIKRCRGRLAAVLVGEKPNRKITSLVKRLHLTDSVQFTGPLFNDALDSMYLKARIFMLTSRWEGLPMAALEAMSAGMPVVATDVGDVGDLVKHGQSGFLIPVGDVDQAAKAVDTLLNDQKLYQSMSKGAREAADALICKSTLAYVMDQWRYLFAQIGLL